MAVLLVAKKKNVMFECLYERGMVIFEKCGETMGPHWGSPP